MHQEKSRGIGAELVEVLRAKHGLEISEPDLIRLENWKLQFIKPMRYEDHPAPIVLGRGFFGVLGGILAIGAAALITGGLSLPLASLAFAIGSTTFGLLGQILFRQKDNNENFAPLNTISSGAPLARVGNPAPVIYCDRSIKDPAGGVRVESPPLVFSEVRAIGGLQQLKLIYLLSVGELGEISSSPEDILIDDQPINEVLLSGEYQVTSTLGKPSETQVLAPYSSQSIEVSVSNNVGGRIVIRRDDIGSVSGAVIVFEEEGALSSISPSDRLSLSSSPDEENPFRLVSRNRPAMSATFSRAIESTQNIWAVSSFVYRTTRPVDRLTINLNIVLWERNRDGDFIEKSSVFDMYLTGSNNVRTKVGRFGVRGRNPNGVPRSFELRGLGRQRYKIELVPRLKPNDSETIWTIGDTGAFSNQTIGGFTVAFQREEDISTTEANRLNIVSNKSQYSYESQYPITVQSVNEIVTDGAKNYPGFSMFSLLIDGNERISREPRVSILVKKGRKIRNLLSAGSATANGTNILHAVTHDFTGQADPVKVGDRVRNLATRQESTVTAVNQLSLGVNSGAFSQGDRFLVYRRASSSLFSDIAIDMLTDDRVKSSAILDADEAVAYELFAEVRNWHLEQGIFWNGIVAAQVPYGQWFADQLGLVRCLPYTAAGQLGIIPDRDEEISNIYTPQNMLASDAYERSFTSQNDRPYNQVVLRYRDGSDRLFRVKEVIVRTTAVSTGAEPPNEQVIEAEVITTLDKAVELAQFVLQGLIHQDIQFSWATDIQGVVNLPGDAVLVGSTNLRYNGQSAGQIVEVRADGSFKGSLPIDAEFIAFSGDAVANQTDLPLVAVGGGYFTATGHTPEVGDLYITGNLEPRRFKARITESQASPQDNKVNFSAIILPPVIFGTSGLVTDFEATAEALKWDFNIDGPFQSYEGEFNTEAEAIAAMAGMWRYSVGTGACIQAADGQFSTQAFCNQAWANDHFLCALGATAPETANTSGLLQLVGGGVNPQDNFVRVRYFNGALEQSTAALTSRSYGSTDSQIIVSPTGIETQWTILDLTNSNRYPGFVQSGAKVRVWAQPSTIRVFVALGIPSNMLPEKYTDHTGWIDLGAQTVTATGARDFTSTADFSAIKIVMTETGSSAQLQAVDVYSGNFVRAKSDAIAPIPTVSVSQATITPPDTTSDVTVTATIPAWACGTFTNMDFTLYDGSGDIVGTQTTTGTYSAGTVNTATFSSFPSSAYTATVIVRI